MAADYAAAAQTFVDALDAISRMTPREQAERAWHPSADFTMDELEDLFRAERGMDPLPRAQVPGYLEGLQERHEQLQARWKRGAAG